MISCSNGLTLLHLAAEDGNAEFLEMLLNVSTDASIVCLQKLFNVSIDVNVRRNDNGFTPLHYAARLGHEDCVRLLIAKRGQLAKSESCHTTAWGLLY
jgi:ankyrin repeat protein